MAGIQEKDFWGGKLAATARLMLNSKGGRPQVILSVVAYRVSRRVSFGVKLGAVLENI